MAATSEQAIGTYNQLVALIFKIFRIHVLGSTPLTGNKGIFPDSNSLDVFLATKIRAAFKSPKAKSGVRVSIADLGSPPVLVSKLAAKIADKMY